MVPMHIKLLVQNNTTRQVLKEQQLLLCNFSCSTKRDSNTHRCFWASTRSCHKFKKSQSCGSYGLIQAIKDDCKLNELKDDCKLITREREQKSSVCERLKSSFYWSLKLNFFFFVFLNHVINANMMLFHELTLTSLSHVIVLVACITNTFVGAY